jgi:hypothetical protein
MSTATVAYNLITTYGSRQLDAIASLEQTAADAVNQAAPGGPNQASWQVRPLRADDITSVASVTLTNVAAAGAKELFIASSATAGQAGATISFNVPTGRRFCFYGIRNVTPGTKNLSGIQFVISGKATPLYATGSNGGIPLIRAWTDEEGACYFAPVKAFEDNGSVSITFNFLANTSAETWQLLGYYGQTGSQ